MNDFSQIQDYQGPKNSIALPEAGTTAMQTKTTYTTAVAVQEKRDLRKIRDDVLLEAQLAGGSFFYRWTVKGKDGRTSVIQGGSIDLAMSLFRNYRNVAIEVDVKETPTHYLFTAYLVDLETGMTSPRMFRQRKRQNISKKMDRERQEDIVFQIGQSKAIRNAVLRVMPSWLIDKAIGVAQQAELASIRPEQLAEAREKAVSFFGQYGVSREEIEGKLGKTIEQMTAQDVIDLRGEARAIKDGHVSVRELFPAEEEEKQGYIPGNAGPDAMAKAEKPQTIEKEIAPETLDKADGGQPAGPAIWDRDNWCRMRGGKPAEGTGFGAWVIANLDVITEAYEAGEIAPALMDAMGSKWAKLYPGVKFGELAAPAEEPTDKGPAEEAPGTGDEVPLTTSDTAKFEAIGVDVLDSEEAREIMQMVTDSDHLSMLWDANLKHREFHTIDDLHRVINYLRGQLERETLGNHENK